MEVSSPRNGWLIFLVLLMAAVLVVGYNLWSRKKEVSEPYSSLNCPVFSSCPLVNFPSEYPSPIQKITQGYRVGDIIVDKVKRQLRFSGRIDKARGWAQFLLSPQPQQLRVEAAITAPIKLIDLQNAICLLDWKYWEYLRTLRESSLDLSLHWKEGREGIRSIRAVLNKKMSELVFLGTEIQREELISRSCLLLSFSREGARSRFCINSLDLPSRGTEVAITLGVFPGKKGLP